MSATPSFLLLAMGVLGATDIALFHMLAHGLRAHAPSRAELVTHALRGPTYTTLFLALPNLQFAGAGLWALLGVLAFDAAVSIVDFWLEPASRRDLGGLPRGEYVLHVLLAMLFGALIASVLYESADALFEPSAIAWVPFGEGRVPSGLRALLIAMAPLVLFTGALDLRAVLRLRERPS